MFRCRQAGSSWMDECIHFGYRSAATSSSSAPTARAPAAPCPRAWRAGACRSSWCACGPRKHRVLCVGAPPPCGTTAPPPPAPEQHDVRLRAVDSVVVPPPGLLHADAAPLSLQHGRQRGGVWGTPQAWPAGAGDEPPHVAACCCATTSCWCASRRVSWPPAPTAHLGEQLALGEQLGDLRGQHDVPVLVHCGRGSRAWRGGQAGARAGAGACNGCRSWHS